jgi:hypothetical protein
MEIVGRSGPWTGKETVASHAAHITRATLLESEVQQSRIQIFV